MKQKSVKGIPKVTTTNAPAGITMEAIPLIGEPGLALETAYKLSENSCYH